MNKWFFPAISLVIWTVAGLSLFGSAKSEQRAGSGQANQVGRIVSLSPDLTETLFALGLGEKVAAVTLDSDYPAAAKSKPKVGTFWQPSVEAIIAVRPDLVITLAQPHQSELTRRLQRMGYNYLAVPLDTIGDFFSAVAAIGEATGRQQRAFELASYIRNRLDEIAQTVATGPKVKVLWVVQREPLRVAGRETFVNEIIELAGGCNAIGRTLHKYPPIGGEQVIACGAEVIIEPTMIHKAPVGQLGEARRYWSKYANVPAVANDRIYVVDGDIVCRLGPRLVQAVETIAGCLRPDLSAD